MYVTCVRCVQTCLYLNQLQNQLAAAKEAGDDLKVSEMTDSIACVEAAKSLQLDRVQGSQFVLLQVFVRTLQDEGHDIVQPSMVAITVVYVGEILDDSLLKKRCNTTLKKRSQCMNEAMWRRRQLECRVSMLC